VLCADVPESPEPIDVPNLVHTLRYASMPVSYVVSGFESAILPPAQPPLGPAEFEALVLQAVAAYSLEDLNSWFWHGQGPIKGAGQELANQLHLPEARTLSGRLREALQRPRLSGAQPFVAQLSSALALPAPQRRHSEQP